MSAILRVSWRVAPVKNRRDLYNVDQVHHGGPIVGHGDTPPDLTDEEIVARAIRAANDDPQIDASVRSSPRHLTLSIFGQEEVDGPDGPHFPLLRVIERAVPPAYGPRSWESGL